MLQTISKYKHELVYPIGIQHLGNLKRRQIEKGNIKHSRFIFYYSGINNHISIKFDTLRQAIAMLDKIRKVEQVFKQLDKETEKFGIQSNLKCLTNCNLCCLKKGLEGNVLEFLPLANYLVKNNLHEAALDLLDTNPEHCINLAKSQVPGQTAGCSNYDHRGMICRLFGFSGVKDKNSKLAVYTCTHIKKEYPQEFKNAMERINSGMKIPMVTDFYYQIYFVDSYMANDYNPINVSIRKAIEKVAYYYANKSRRTKKSEPIIKVEKEN